MLRESMQSRLDPLRRVVEELGSRREDGLNNFTANEPAVGRLLNTLDDVLNSDTIEEGGLFMFVAQAVRTTLKQSDQTHGPVDKVEGQRFKEPISSSRYWIICCLTVPGALKDTLHRILPCRDILQAFYKDIALVRQEGFPEAFLSALTLLHQPVQVATPTFFNLDVTALQLFFEKSHAVTTTRVRLRPRPTGPTSGNSAPGAGGGTNSGNLSNGSAGDAASGLAAEFGGAGGDKDRKEARRRHHRHHDANGHGEGRSRSRARPSCFSVETQTEHPVFRIVEEGSTAALANGPEVDPASAPRSVSSGAAATPVVATGAAGAGGSGGAGAGAGGSLPGSPAAHSSLLSSLTVASTGAVAAVAAAAAAATRPRPASMVAAIGGSFRGAVASVMTPAPGQPAPLRGGATMGVGGGMGGAQSGARALSESWCQTEQPSPSVTFADLCEMERDYSERDRGIKASEKRLRDMEAAWKEKNDDVNDRLQALTATLRSLKSLYNDMFCAAHERQSGKRDIDESDVHPLVPKLMAVLYCNAQVVMPGQQQQQQQQWANIPTVPMSGTSDEAVSPTITDADPSKFSGSSFVGTPNTAGGAVLDRQLLLAAAQAATVSDANATSVGSRQTSQAPLIADIGSTTPPAKVLGDLPLVLVAPVERDREQQLKLQGNKCPGCKEPFNQSEGNVLSKVMQRAGSALHLDKPRRCHYCTQLFCHKCHANRTTILPFRAAVRWDFTPQHVCNKCCDFLAANIDRALYNTATLPADIGQRPNIVTAVALRKKMVRLNRSITTCRDAQSSLQMLLRSYYFTRETYFSLADFAKLRTGDSKLTTLNNAIPIGNAQDDLNATLLLMYKKVRGHATDQCRTCIAENARRCAICNDSKPVFCFDENGMKCACGNIYHLTCYETMGCSKCGTS